MSYANPNIIPSGTSFPQLQAGGASGQLERLITANSAATANPATAATLSATAGGVAGGLLAPGTYYATFTESNGLGETKPAPESGPVTVAAQAPPAARTHRHDFGIGGHAPRGQLPWQIHLCRLGLERGECVW